MNPRAAFVRCIEWVLTVFGGLFVLYAVAYLTVVTRTVARTGNRHATEGGYREYISVSAGFRGRVGLALFRPALDIDRFCFRRRYWSGWYDLTTATSTNRDYDIDRQTR